MQLAALSNHGFSRWGKCDHMSVKGKDKLYRESLLEALADPEEAAIYLAVALDDSQEMFRKACRNVVDAILAAGPSRAKARSG